MPVEDGELLLALEVPHGVAVAGLRLHAEEGGDGAAAVVAQVPHRDQRQRGGGVACRGGYLILPGHHAGYGPQEVVVEEVGLERHQDAIRS